MMNNPVIYYNEGNWKKVSDCEQNFKQLDSEMELWKKSLRQIQHHGYRTKSCRAD